MSVVVAVGFGVAEGVIVGMRVVVDLGAGVDVGALDTHRKRRVSLGGLTVPSTPSSLPRTTITRQ